MTRKRFTLLIIFLGLTGAAEAQQPHASRSARADDPFGALELPAAWREQFWNCSAGRKLISLELRALADLVPVQSGLRFCRCPACGAGEREEPLAWSLDKPAVLTCRRCGIVVPNEQFPAKVNDHVPEEAVEVLPGVVHRYPYHNVEESKARYPDERLYFQARIDYERREFLAKAALYAAVLSRATGTNSDRRPAEMACVILLRFAQVYSAYAIHHDQPDRPKTIYPATLRPPYPHGYQTAKWEWSGSLEVPLNLVMAYSLVRESPAWVVVGKLLNDPTPTSTVERQLLRATAEFARVQPQEISTDGLSAARGLLAAARVLDDGSLAAEGRRRLLELTRRGFYHDGVWRDGDSASQQRVLGLLDGWMAAELVHTDPAVVRASGVAAASGHAPAAALAPTALTPPIIDLARRAGAMLHPAGFDSEIRQVSWPNRSVVAGRSAPMLLGGAGIARLSVGEGPRAFEVELLGQDSYGKPRFQRLSLRVRVAGSPMLDDLQEQPPTGTGWDLATPSHNVVVVDGLNQRETPGLASQPAAAGNILFYAADPDFQVACLDDPRAYPQSATRYRQSVVLSAGPELCYALNVFEVHGGLQHDQIFHAAPRRGGRWTLAEKLTPGPASLLPSSIRFVPSAPREQGRWFVQSFGEFQPQSQAVLTRPTVAHLLHPEIQSEPNRATEARNAADARAPASVRLHLLGPLPATAIIAASPEPTRSADSPQGGSESRSGLIVRRRSAQGETLKSTFVTLIEPTGPEFHSLERVGRVDSPPDVVVVFVQSAAGGEYVLVNLEPGSTRRVQLPSGRYVSFDGLALRVRENALALAGGSYAEGSGRLVSIPRLGGTLTGTSRMPSGQAHGWFLTPEILEPDPAIAGRTLIVEHGDGTQRAWTLQTMERLPEGTRLHVREEPGFVIDPADGSAHYYQFPRLTAPGPHRFRLARIAR